MVIEHRHRRALRLRGPDLLEAAGTVSEKVLLAAHDASKQLQSLGIAHALIGGIAVGAHGAPRATRDVDFLVREAEAFSGGRILSFRPGVPIAVGDVVIDYLTPEGAPYVELLQHAISRAPVTEGIPVLALEPLVLMKLHAGRRRDLDDVQRLLDQADTEADVRKYITLYAPDLLERLDLALGG